MTRRHLWMVLAAVIIVTLSVIILPGCADNGEVHKEKIHGRDCLVRRDRINGRVIAMSCDWEN